MDNIAGMKVFDAEPDIDRDLLSVGIRVTLEVLEQIAVFAKRNNDNGPRENVACDTKEPQDIRVIKRAPDSAFTLEPLQTMTFAIEYTSIVIPRQERTLDASSCPVISLDPLRRTLMTTFGENQLYVLC